jgi:hypothetical protein
VELQAIFEELHGIRLCKSAYDFSTNYLGKSQSYYSVLKANEVKPSIDTLAILEIALKEKASDYENDKYDIFTLRRKQLLSLSNAVSEIRNQRCIDALSKYDSEVLK